MRVMIDTYKVIDARVYMCNGRCCRRRTSSRNSWREVDDDDLRVKVCMYAFRSSPKRSAALGFALPLRIRDASELTCNFLYVFL